MKRSIESLFTILFAVSLLLVSCSDSTTGTGEQQPPQLPPASSMQADFSTFDSANPKPVSADQTSAMTNFYTAVSATTLAKAIIELNVAIPKAIFSKAENIKPELNSEGQWEWTYSASTNGQSFKARLAGSVSANDTVDWKMYITIDTLDYKADNFMFFEGTTTLDGKEGTWIYYDLNKPDQQVKVSKMDWTIDSETSKTLTLEVLSNRNDNRGDTITYTLDGSVKTVTFLDTSKDETTEIQWNDETKAGYVISPNYNGGVKSCRDQNFQDTACTE